MLRILLLTFSALIYTFIGCHTYAAPCKPLESLVYSQEKAGDLFLIVPLPPADFTIADFPKWESLGIDHESIDEYQLGLHKLVKNPLLILNNQFEDAFNKKRRYIISLQAHLQEIKK